MSYFVDKNDKPSLYNMAMKLITGPIPQEYLALRINYCREQLDQLPEVKLQIHNQNEIPSQKLFADNHRYTRGTEKGDMYYDIWLKRDALERELRIDEAVWHSNFRGAPFPECIPHKANRTIFISPAQNTVLDRSYFDSLKNDADKKHPKPLDYPFNGIYYRSAAEREIAMLYTAMGIPFKYEPEVYIKGIPYPIYPDFVIYIEELDNCKFHEHFGIKNSAAYLKVTGIKYTNYSNAGLIPELDILFTHDTEEYPFDIRELLTKLNAAVYATLIKTKRKQ